MRSAVVCFGSWLTVSALLAAEGDVDNAVTRLLAVGKEGKGNVAASQAWRDVVGQGPKSLVPLLGALDSADAVAANWLRAAFEAVAERELAAGRAFPADQLEKFLRDSKHNPAARRLAYEWLVRVDPKTPDRLLPEMLQDPSVELRRDAVARVMGEAASSLKAGDKEAATKAYQKALSGARDPDQVDELAKVMKPLGVDVNVAAHYGFIRTWKVIGPFDNAEFVGFNKAYPPEQGVKLDAVYKGKKDAELKWQDHTTTDAKGLVDLNKAVGKHMGAVAYAFATVNSSADRPVELRVGSNNAIKIWLNGKELLAHDEYHHGMKMDQYVAKGQLRMGKNEILLKICQNEQTEAWAQTWSYQLRVCDSVGGAVPVEVAFVSEAAERKEAKDQ